MVHMEYVTIFDELSECLKAACVVTEVSRVHSPAHLEAHATQQEVHVRDTVVEQAAEPMMLTLRWDPQYEVKRGSFISMLR